MKNVRTTKTTTTGTTLRAVPPPGPRAERDRVVAIWLGIARKLIAADAHNAPSAIGYRRSLTRVETRLSARHPITLGRLLAWETRWLHVGRDGDTTCPTCTEMRTGPAPVRSTFIDRAWLNL
jgi:hypothetical protein